MERIMWQLVSRMLAPLNSPVLDHKLAAFDWSPEFWARMAMTPSDLAREEKATVVAKAELKKREKHAAALKLEIDTVGVFEL